MARKQERKEGGMKREDGRQGGKEGGQRLDLTLWGLVRDKC